MPPLSWDSASAPGARSASGAPASVSCGAAAAVVVSVTVVTADSDPLEPQAARPSGMRAMTVEAIRRRVDDTSYLRFRAGPRSGDRIGRATCAASGAMIVPWSGEVNLFTRPAPVREVAHAGPLLRCHPMRSWRRILYMYSVPHSPPAAQFCVATAASEVSEVFTDADLARRHDNRLRAGAGSTVREKLSRLPDYFHGLWSWWGHWVAVVATGWGALALIAPLLLTPLLLWVTDALRPCAGFRNRN